MHEHRTLLAVLSLSSLLLAASCATSSSSARSGGEGPRACPETPFSRDWTRFPAIIELPELREPLYAVGDVHGALPELKELLVRAGLIRLEGADGFEWTGGKAVLVQTGDLINKGPLSLAAIEFAIALEEKAAAQGGRALFVAGNHEIGFLAKAPQKWYRHIADEAKARGLEVCSGVHAAGTVFGQWLRTRPAAVVVGGLYFSHSGNSQGMTRAQIDAFYRDLIDRADWGSKRGCGDPSAHLPGFFNADVWWGPHGSRLDGWLSALGVRQAVFGNDPNAFKAKGKLVAAFGNEAGRALFKLDVGTVYGDSRGAILRCAEVTSAGCVDPQRLLNPPAGDQKQGAVTFEKLPIDGEPPAQDEPPPASWGC
ncbi:MAG: metallophosphoesterase [Myxococcales bacterium]